MIDLTHNNVLRDKVHPGMSEYRCVEIQGSVNMTMERHMDNCRQQLLTDDT